MQGEENMKRVEKDGRVVAVLEKRSINAHREGYFIVQVCVCVCVPQSFKPPHKYKQLNVYKQPSTTLTCISISEITHH